MSNPNIVNVSAIYGKTTFYTPSSSSTVVLLNNSASSGKVYKINQIYATNSNTTSAVNASVAIYTNGSVGQGGSPSGGSTYTLVSSLPVPVNLKRTIPKLGR